MKSSKAVRTARIFYASVGVAAALAVSGQALADNSYTITALNLGGQWGIANGINNNGQIVGEYYANAVGGGTVLHAFVYNNGAMTDITKTPPGYANGSGRATAINDNGQVVGETSFYGAASYTHGFLYQGGTYTDLGALSNAPSYASAINSSGQIVGSAYPNGYTGTGAEYVHAFLYQGGVMSDINPRSGEGFAAAINSAGVIAGGVNVGGEYRGFINDHGVVTEYSTLGFLKDINDLGQTVGLGITADESAVVATIWNNGVATNIGTLGQDSLSMANAINNKGQVVGYSGYSGDVGQRAILYTDGLLFDLNNLLSPNSGWVLNYATDINDRGQIIGTGLLNGVHTSFVMTPTVPVPAAAWLFGSGLLGLGALNRRRAR
jgi:probable HAF family extracellular repeat protein